MFSAIDKQRSLCKVTNTISLPITFHTVSYSKRQRCVFLHNLKIYILFVNYISIKYII